MGGRREREQIKQEMDADTFRRGFYARLEAAKLTGDKLVQEHRNKVAEALLSAGINLIPSDHLRDHEFVVSRGVYEAAKKIAL